MSSPSPNLAQPARRPPASLLALGHAGLPAEVAAQGVTWRFAKLFKHDFFAATALYEQRPETPPATQNPALRTGESLSGAHALVGMSIAMGFPQPTRASAPRYSTVIDSPVLKAQDPGLKAPGDLRRAVLKVQRTHPFYGLPMRWLGKRVARHEIRIFRALQGVPGIPQFLGTVGSTGFLHEFIPGTDLHAKLPLTPEFFGQLEQLFTDVHDRHIAYVDSNKRENILHGDDGRPWLIDFQISFHLPRGPHANFLARWTFRRLVRADWYHFYKHKTRLLPAACTPEDFAKAKNRGLLHQLHRLLSRPFIVMRRKLLARYDY